MNPIRYLTEFVRDAIRAETLTTPGRLNLYGLTLLFIVVIGGGWLFNLLQILIRAFWRSDYTTGLPSTLSLVVVYGGLMLLCVALLVWAERNRR